MKPRVATSGAFARGPSTLRFMDQAIQDSFVPMLLCKLTLVGPVNDIGIGRHHPEELLAQVRRQLALTQSILEEVIRVRVEAILSGLGVVSELRDL